MNKSPERLIRIISLLLLVLFVYTASSKLIGFESFESVLSRSSLIKSYATVLSWLVPVSELAAAFLLFLPRTRRLGLLVSMALMALFTAYIGLMLISNTELPCSCGGVVSALTWNEHLVFNIFFLILSIIGYTLDRNFFFTARASLLSSQQTIYSNKPPAGSRQASPKT